VSNVGSPPGKSRRSLGEEGRRVGGTIRAEARLPECKVSTEQPIWTCLSSLRLRGQIRQVQVPKKFPHEAFDFDQVAQCIWLCRIDSAGIAHLGQELGRDIVVVLNLVRQQRRAKKILERIDDAVEELQDEKGLDLG